MSFDEVRKRLESHGIQASSPRLAIAHFVLNTKTHPTAEEVKTEVEKAMPSVSLATIYNTLNLFVAKGLIKAVRDPESERFRYDCNVSPHFHFYDETTGKLIDLNPTDLGWEKTLRDKLSDNFEIREIDIVVRGKKKPLNQSDAVRSK